MKRKIFLLSLVAAVFTLAIAGCQREGCTDLKATNYDSSAKKDNGTCVYAEQVVPTKVVVIDWDWNVDPKFAPWMDTIKFYADQADVKDVYINMVNKQSDPTLADVTGALCDGMLPKYFHTARDSMETRFEYSDKVKGSGTILVSRQGGAQLPDLEHGVGMALEDSIWFAAHGFKIERWRGHSKMFNK